MRITTIQLIAITCTDVMTTSSISSAVPTPAGTAMMMVDVTGTLLDCGMADSLVVMETILDVVKCVWVSKRCVPISGTLLTGVVTASSVISAVSLLYSDNCDDGVRACDEYVEQFMGITVSLEPQHMGSPLAQLVQSLLL